MHKGMKQYLTFSLSSKKYAGKRLQETVDSSLFVCYGNVEQQSLMLKPSYKLSNRKKVEDETFDFCHKPF